MPEFVEVEAYRRTVEPLVGERIDAIDVFDDRLLRHAEPPHVYGVLGGATIERARRTGKVLLIDVSGGHTAALGFGLRGWLSLDGQVARAHAGSETETWRRRPPRPDHVRLRVAAGTRCLELEDQLRMATLQIDVDEDRLGPDVLTLDKDGFRALLARSGTAVKTLLMDQERVAGVGNLIADEICYQGGIDPRRIARELTAADVDDLWIGFRRTRTRVLERNGSHQGVMIQHGARTRGAECPRCGVEMRRVQVGGRTTFFCPSHQR